MRIRCSVSWLWLALVALLGGCGTGGGQPVEAGARTPVAPTLAPGEFVDTAVEPTSTFAADVDTGSYTLLRRDLLQGRLPAPESVRPEEYLNFFEYRYPQPSGEEPFSINVDAAPSPFGEGLHLLRIGLAGRTISEAERKPANLVFLVDVSCSMSEELPLVKFALKELVRRLEGDDTIGIVTYAGADRVALEPTPVSQRARVLDVIESFQTGGATAGEAGIRGAYALAERARREGGINRVILCTDGDFNVGLRGDALIALIEQYRDQGITLTTLGFGGPNYQDRQLEQLADHGNGNYGYVDNPGEAVRFLARSSWRRCRSSPRT